MLAKSTQLSSPPAEDASMAASKVLGDDNLLGEIVHRIDSPASLVRAALVSKRWLGAASDRAFLRRLRASRQPRLVGFYVTGDCMPHPEFVPMPTSSQPADPELGLGAAIRRASFDFGIFPVVSSHVWDCRNGRVLFELSEVVHGVRRLAVRAPGEDMSALPPLPPDLLVEERHALLLPDDDGDEASCYIVGLNHSGPQVTARVVALRSGAWTLHCSAEAVLPSPPDPMLTAFAAGKIYTVAVAGYILGLDMAAARFFVIELPNGAAYEYYGNIVPCRGDDGNVLYLFHLKGDQLLVWLRRMVDDRGAGEWVLRDTISLQKTCGHLTEHGRLEPAPGHTALASVVGVGDNAEFVFLELEDGGIFVCIHLNSRKVEKVYQRDPDNDEITLVFPSCMVWPPNPIFPALA